jgi:mannose/fructose/N-acetylgalactosamine-specific phosphotransferase system component IIC
MFGLIKKDAQPRRVVNEDELQSYEQEDNYKRKKWLLNSTTAVMVVVIVAIPVVLALTMAFDTVIRGKVIDLIVGNVPGLLYAGLAIGGVRLSTRKGSK